MSGGATKGARVVAEPAFVFHQLPGCGSKEMVEFIYSNFAVVHDEPDATGGAPEAGEPVRPVDPAWLSAAKLFLFRSHFRPGGVFIEKLYPEFFADDRFETILFVDEPLRLAAVTYLHVSRRGDPACPATFGKFLRTRRNPMAWYLGVTAQTFEAALDRYSFVGVNERKAESMRGLFRVLREAIDGANETPNVRRTGYQLRRWSAAPPEPDREVEIEKLMKSAGFLDRFLFNRRNSLDARIHHAASKRLEAWAV